MRPFEWMKQSVGVSFHWTSHSAQLNGDRKPYEEAVNAFDPIAFAEQLARIGARHCLFTLTHAEQYLAFPNAPLEKLMPGRTTERDLIGEIIEALDRRNIRFIAYYNHSCNGNDDVPWKKACGYADGISGDLDAFAQNICDIVGFTAKRYGSGIKGWWFDSPYSVDPRGPHNSVTTELGDWQFPWEKLIKAAKSGSDECAVSVNAGIGSNFLYVPHEDYYAGESVRLFEPFTPAPRPDIIQHRWTCIENPRWCFSQECAREGFARPRFSEEEVVTFLRQNRQEGCMSTFNMEIAQSGEINPFAMERFAAAVRRLEAGN